MREKIEKEKQESIKKAIIDVAKDIVENDGFENLSIRKIAKQVGYSPGSIYQYFSNKDHIVEMMISESYSELIKILKKDYKKFDSVAEEIEFRYKKYIEFALDNSNYFKIIMLSENKNILSKTSVLKEGSTKNKGALLFLRHFLEKGIDNSEFKINDIELVTQSFWISVYGLIMRLIIEDNIKNSQIEKLINNHLKFLLNSIKGCE